MIKKINPYENLSGTWLKGSLHTHSSPASPCGKQPLETMLDHYERAGYDFLSVSDHLVHTETEDKSDMIMIPGLEWNSRTEEESLDKLTHFNHLGIYSLNKDVLRGSVKHKTHEHLFSYLSDKEGVLTILNHPDWTDPTEHYPYEALKEKHPHCLGMEVYNAVITGLEGKADSTEKWDKILTETGYITGFVSDDSHDISHIHKAWLVVNVAERSKEALFDSLKTGRFYGSTGVAIQDIGRKGDELFCRSDKRVFIEAVGDGGSILATGEGTLTLNAADITSTYLRFVLHGEEGESAWSQPFFV